MAERIALNIVTEIGHEDGNILISGRRGGGDVEVELPGESAMSIIGTLAASLGKLRTLTKEGMWTLFQVCDFELRSSQHPGHLVLVLKLGAHWEMRFAVPRAIALRLAEAVQAAEASDGFEPPVGRA